MTLVTARHFFTNRSLKMITLVPSPDSREQERNMLSRHRQGTGGE